MVPDLTRKNPSANGFLLLLFELIFAFYHFRIYIQPYNEGFLCFIRTGYNVALLT